MTHCQRVLDLLSDGKPHSHHELYRLMVIGHSRIADLRRQGHTIECWHADDAYWYRLLDDGGAASPAAATVVEQPDGQTAIA